MSTPSLHEGCGPSFLVHYWQLVLLLAIFLGQENRVAESLSVTLLGALTGGRRDNASVREGVWEKPWSLAVEAQGDCLVVTLAAPSHLPIQHRDVLHSHSVLRLTCPPERRKRKQRQRSWNSAWCGVSSRCFRLAWDAAALNKQAVSELCSVERGLPLPRICAGQTPSQDQSAASPGPSAANPVLWSTRKQQAIG